jgi:dethiobiotin synthetase
MNYFITGTDTDCGKTFVTALLVRAARAAGEDAVAVKPFCCGPRDDVEILAAANGGVETPDAINPVWMRTPAAPRACELLGEPPADFEAATNCALGMTARHRHVLCEGAGGWLVPLGSGRTIADFAVALGWPVIVVARNKLGVLSHTLLTVESVRRSGLPLVGVILNDTAPCEGPAALTNREVLEECLGQPVLGHVGHGATHFGLPGLLADRT